MPASLSSAEARQLGARTKGGGKPVQTDLIERMGKHLLGSLHSALTEHFATAEEVEDAVHDFSQKLGNIDGRMGDMASREEVQQVLNKLETSNKAIASMVAKAVDANAALADGVTKAAAGAGLNEQVLSEIRRQNKLLADVVGEIRGSTQGIANMMNQVTKKKGKGAFKVDVLSRGKDSRISTVRVSES